MQLIDNIPVWGSLVDEGALRQIKNCAREADRVALMADHHLGYAVPIGGVVAYADSISPSGVGYDIACGNKAVLTDAWAPDVRKNISRLMDDVWKVISFGIGRNNEDEKVDHPLFDDPAWSIKAVAPLKQMARNQLGTVGSGNHYVDIFSDERDRVWIGVHFGSRGLYAYAGRDWVCDRVARVLGASILEEVHNHHNFAWRECHEGADLWVVRKGATPAFPGQRGFVGGTMGEQSVILEGVESELGVQSLYSTIHGAGRVMGRMEAKGKVDKQGVVTREGKVTQAMMDDWVTGAHVELRGAGVDESPHCYKRLQEVLAEHEGMIRVIHTLTPIGVAMAGKDTFDPFKD